ncbi:MAG: hypothetical protein ONB25_12585 [candidate division KSB1 bacterium]|nr:hypothetical protein [candidate division KSB1 bacterium]
MEDLRELSRAHHNAKASVTQEQNEQVLALPSFGARRIKEHFQLFISHKAIRRIWRGAALLKSKRTKYKTTQDPGAVKAQWRLFEQTYTDAKAVIDVPEDWPHIRVLALAKVNSPHGM